MTIALADLDFRVREIEDIRLRKLKDLLTHLRAAALITGNANIAALAGLTGAADKVPYFTGAGAMALADLPAFGRTLIANASAADARSDLAISATNTPFTPTGAIAATDVQTAIAELDTEKQPLDADLTAIAALTTTAFGRSALALADAAALRTLAGLGTAAVKATGVSGDAVPVLNGAATTWAAGSTWGGTVDVSGSIRATGVAAPAAGAGVEVYYESGEGKILAFDRSGGTYKILNLFGSSIILAPGGTTVLTATGTGVDVVGEARCDSLRIDAAPSVSVATASTHKLAVNLNGSTYYLLLSNV